MRDDMQSFAATEDWLERFQLKHDPFAPRPAGFRFFQPKRKEVLAQLHHFARFGDRPVLVSGPEGSGKTLLRQALVVSSDKNSVQSVVMSGKDMPDAEQLLAHACLAVGVSGRDEAALLEAAQNLARTGMQVWLVVDDAQLLTAAALQMLLDVAGAGQKDGVRLFLFADGAVERLLLQVESPLDGDWLQRILLKPLDAGEMAVYLTERLEAAGQGIELFDEAQLEWLHEHSEGWHGRINELARELLATGDEPVAAARSLPAMPWRSLAALVLVGVGVLIAWRMGDTPQEPARTVLQLPEPVVEASMEAPPQPSLPVQSGQAAALQAVAEDELEESLAADVVSEPVPPPVLPEVDAEPDVVAPPQDTPVATVAPVVAAEPVPAAVPAAMAQPPASQPAAAPTPTPAPAPAARTNEPPARTVAPAGGLHGADWYRQRKANEYVLQLLGSRSRQAALDFAAQHRQLSDLALLETTHEGKPWYVVTQGVYADRQRAQQAIAKLPENLRRQSPWPRSIGSVQQALP